MTFEVQYGQKETVFVIIAYHPWCFWTTNGPISIHCFIRQQSQSGEESQIRVKSKRFLPELFVFVAVPGVPAHNNLAERSVRPLIVARKISRGTRSPKGSQTRMGLANLFGTWMAQSLNPFHQSLALLSTKSSSGRA